MKQLQFRQGIAIIAIVPLIVLASILIYGTADILLSKLLDPQSPDLSGSTLRVIRKLSYCNFIQCHGPDSWGPMGKALAVLNGSQSDRLYETIFFTGAAKFQYPPTSLLLYDLLHSVGLANAVTLNNLNLALFLLNAALVVLIFRSALHSTGRDARVGAGTWVILIASALLFYPTLSGLEIGQVQIWINALFSAACLSWLKDKRLLAGVFIGLALTLKPQFALFGLWALVWRERAFLFGLLLSFVPLTLLSLARYGLHNHIEYLNVLSFLSQHGEIYFENQTMNGLIGRLVFVDSDNSDFSGHTFPPFNTVVWLASIATAAALFLVAIYKPPYERGQSANIFDFAIVGLCAVVAAPIAWEHHYAILLPFLFISLSRIYSDESARDASLQLLALTVAWVLIANSFNIANLSKSTPLNILQSYRFAGGLIFLFLLVHQRRRLANDFAYEPHQSLAASRRVHASNGRARTPAPTEQ